MAHSIQFVVILTKKQKRKLFFCQVDDKLKKFRCNAPKRNLI